MKGHNINYWIYPGLTYRIYNLSSTKIAIMNMFGIHIDDFDSRTRKREVVEARYAYCYISRKKLNYTLDAVGASIDRNHATVIHGVKLVESLIEQDRSFRNKIAILESNVEINNRHGIKR